MVEVILTDEAAEWLDGLDPRERAQVVKAIDLLEQMGIGLGFPHCSDLKESKKYPFRELRVGGTLRPVYIYDKRRDAVVVCGGDKAGDKGFYKRIIAMAEKIWEQYLREQG